MRIFKHLTTCATAALAFAALPACAQSPSTSAPAAAATDADPALWVVKDNDTTIYLFGTVHVLKPGLSWFDEAVKTAFDRSDTLVLEMVQPDEAAMQKLVMSKGVNPTGPTLTEMLPADKRDEYAQALAGMGLPAAALDRFKPWMAAVTLSLAPIQKLGYAADSGAEKVLTAAAKSANKEVVGLETAEQQLGFFDGLSQPAQVMFLTSTLDELPNIGTEMDKMVISWSKGDPDALAAVLNDSLQESPEVAKVLLTDRNQRWAEWIDGRMDKPGTVFVAVGAGHLAGDEAVQSFLARRGLKAERVRY